MCKISWHELEVRTNAQARVYTYGSRSFAGLARDDHQAQHAAVAKFTAKRAIGRTGYSQNSLTKCKLVRVAEFAGFAPESTCTRLLLKIDCYHEVNIRVQLKDSMILHTAMREAGRYIIATKVKIFII